MDRLTRRAEAEGIKAVYYGKNDVFLEGEPGYAEANKLAHYEDLEESGRLVVLPCKVGEIVWVSKNKEKTRRVLLDSIADILWYMEHGYGIGYTRKEAEAALKGSGQDE